MYCGIQCSIMFYLLFFNMNFNDICQFVNESYDDPNFNFGRITNSKSDLFIYIYIATKQFRDW